MNNEKMTSNNTVSCHDMSCHNRRNGVDFAKNQARKKSSRIHAEMGVSCRKLTGERNAAVNWVLSDCQMQFRIAIGVWRLAVAKTIFEN